MIYKIHPIVMGAKIFDKGMMTYQHDYGKPFVIPIFSWYIEGGDKNILIDTGEFAPRSSTEIEKAIGKVYTFEEGLAKYGLKPEDIDIVFHTHLHNDHCENDSKCINARFYVHEKELEQIHNPHALDFRYNEDFITEVESNGQIIPLKEDTEILPGIKMIHTPAHTPGGMSILIDTEKGKALITGFCVIEENLNPPPKILGMGMEVIPPGTLVNSYEAYDILLKVKEIAEIVIPLHEPKYAFIESIPQ
ncbi:N-acyl homoserine lactonase family protein [Thermodesulfovibrio yellowstonii]|uniref:MBL fold metallo-hydrolase n=1 Tax=Thermodesulfovibrio yellowstonii TaxID=28262 RepID=A0A9W6LK99_9BACT|nr:MULTISPECIES: N-acyl homoserine lactonase family protein [Thermodesulfovibrio]MDI6865530.1 N-acyl homoserine lactonase family protein [Thermodesulfovibrio yellowstonii]GLI53028.1 MBL fold metallo-hydrolase [Thermodesulfovibrio islandicus]